MHMIAKRMAWLACCVLMATVYAMPTKEELAQAQSLVNDLTADDLRALKAKEKTPGDVAAAHLALADKADTEAGKYLLLQGAFKLYVRNADYDAAADVLARMRQDIADLPPELIVDIVNKEMRRVASAKAPKVLAIVRDAQRMIKYRKQLATAELDATAHPENVRYQRRVAECHVCLGDWPKAIEIFAKIGDEAAKFELDPTSAKGYDAIKAVDFWWGYKAVDPEPFKAHAVSLYRAAIDANQVSGLRREMASKRIAELEASGVPIMAATLGERATSPTPGQWAIPANFKVPLVRTLKLDDDVDMDFCAVPAGTFQMSYPDGSPKAKQGKTHKVTITRPFWFSKTLVTTKQYRRFKPVPSDRNAACKDLETRFPDFDVIHTVWSKDVDSYVEDINRRFGHLLPKGYVFRLPTEAEWEHAYGGGNGKGTKDMGVICPKVETNRMLDKHGLKWVRGSYLVPRDPKNRLGIIGGPTDELIQIVLDSIDGRNGVMDSRSAWEHYDYGDHEIDPVRLGKTRIIRYRATKRTMHPNVGGIFRLVIGPDLVAEKKAARKTGSR